MRNRIPFDLAFSERDATAFRRNPRVREAASIIFAQFEGAEFDWSAYSFKDRT